MVLVKNCQFFMFFFLATIGQENVSRYSRKKKRLSRVQKVEVKKGQKICAQRKAGRRKRATDFHPSHSPLHLLPVTSVSLVFRVSLCGNKEALEEDIGNTQSLNDNYRLYSKANQEFTTLQNTLFPRNKNNLLFVFTRTIKQKWRSRELISQAA